jgi:hypothetical protein
MRHVTLKMKRGNYADWRKHLAEIVLSVLFLFYFSELMYSLLHLKLLNDLLVSCD